MRLAIAILGTVIVSAPIVLQADEPKADGAPATKLRADGLKQAKADDKRVFLIFGSQGCGWCKVFDKYHADSDVARVLGKYLVIVKISTDENPGGQEMYLEYGKQRGVPAFSVLDSGGNVLADSGDGGKNIGFPYQPHEIEHYFTALADAFPAIRDSDIALLREKLKEVRPKKD
jgi:hypothetical protein